MNYENFDDYLLSLNVTQICREYGFKKIGMNSLYHLTNILRMFISNMAKNSKDYCELSNRTEVNLIDLLNSLLDQRKGKESIVEYIKESKLKYPFTKKSYVKKIMENEIQERELFNQKINSNNIINTDSISKETLELIPPIVKYFPKDFALKKTEIKLNVAQEELKKAQSMIKNIEKKTLEDVISANNYFDNLSKKHKRKNSIDINNLFQEIQTNKEISLGFTLKQESKGKKVIQEKAEDQNILNIIKSMNNNQTLSEEDEDEIESSQMDIDDNPLEDF